MIEKERERLIAELYVEVDRCWWRGHARRVADLILALDLHEATAPYKPKYSVTVCNRTVTASFSSEALTEQRQVQELIDELNNSVTEVPE
jgi:hypothetical protein